MTVARLMCSSLCPANPASNQPHQSPPLGGCSACPGGTVAKYRNISGVDIRGPFIPGEYAEAGEVVELPDEQVVYGADGEVTERLPMIHPADVWEPVDRK